MKLSLILITTFIPFVSFLQKTGVLVLSGDADYYDYKKSEFVVYHNEVALGRFDATGQFICSSDQKGPLVIKHPDFITITVDVLTFTKKRPVMALFEKINPEIEQKWFDQLKDEQIKTCTGSIKSDITHDLATLDSIASFPGGLEKMREFLQDNLVYPQKAVEHGVEGKVYISFIVEVDGSVTCIEIRKGVDYLLDKEAFRCIKNFPKFKPAESKGVAVPTVYSLPISFKLS